MVVWIVFNSLAFAYSSNRVYVVEVSKFVNSLLERSHLAVPVRGIEFNRKGFRAVLFELLGYFLCACVVLVCDANVDSSRDYSAIDRRWRERYESPTLSSPASPLRPGQRHLHLLRRISITEQA